MMSIWMLSKCDDDMQRVKSEANTIEIKKQVVFTVNSELLTMKAKHGNNVVLDFNRVEYKQNLTHVKQFIEPCSREKIIPSPVAISTVNLLSEEHVDLPMETVENP